jgi:hypothetical protein
MARPMDEACCSVMVEVGQTSALLSLTLIACAYAVYGPKFAVCWSRAAETFRDHAQL